MHCHNCGNEIDTPTEKVRRSETCLKCSSYLHCCYNCKMYEPNADNQCREPQAERVQDKEGANFCGYFEAGDAKPATSSRKEEALKKLNDLFKK